MRIKFQRVPPRVRPGPKRLQRRAHHHLRASLVLDDGQRRSLASMKIPPSEGEARRFLRDAVDALAVFGLGDDHAQGLIQVLRERAALEHIKAFAPENDSGNVIDLPKEIAQRKLAKVFADYLAATE
jgi:hypothetical protein